MTESEQEKYYRRLNEEAEELDEFVRVRKDRLGCIFYSFMMIFPAVLLGLLAHIAFAKLFTPNIGVFWGVFVVSWVCIATYMASRRYPSLFSHHNPSHDSESEGR